MTSVNNHITNISSWSDSFQGALGVYGRNVSLVAGEPIFRKGTEYEYPNNGFALYGGFAAGFDTKRSITNRELGSIYALYWEPDQGNIEGMDSSQIVGFYERSNRNFIRRDHTLANSTTDPARFLSNLRIVQALIAYMRERLGNRVGEPMLSDDGIKTRIEEAIQMTPGPKYVNYRAEVNRLEGGIYLSLDVALYGFLHEISVSIYLRV